MHTVRVYECVRLVAVYAYDFHHLLPLKLACSEKVSTITVRLSCGQIMSRKQSVCMSEKG